MQVLDHEYQRPLGRCQLERRPPGGEEGGTIEDIGVGGTDGGSQQVRSLRRRVGSGILQPSTRTVADLLGGRVLVGQFQEVEQERAHGPVGEALPVGQALGDRQLRGRRERIDPGEELLHQAALPGPGWRDEAHQERALLAEGPASDELQLGEVGVASHERRARSRGGGAA